MRSVGQRASKLPAFKLSESFDPEPTRTLAVRTCIAHTLAEIAEVVDFFLRTPTFTASNFAAL